MQPIRRLSLCQHGRIALSLAVERRYPHHSACCISVIVLRTRYGARACGCPTRANCSDQDQCTRADRGGESRVSRMLHPLRPTKGPLITPRRAIYRNSVVLCSARNSGSATGREGVCSSACADLLRHIHHTRRSMHRQEVWAVRFWGVIRLDVSGVGQGGGIETSRAESSTVTPSRSPGTLIE